MGEFAYADLKSARKYSWFPQLLRAAAAQPIPLDFEKFLSFCQALTRAIQVEELAWGLIQTS